MNLTLFNSLILSILGHGLIFAAVCALDALEPLIPEGGGGGGGNSVSVSFVASELLDDSADQCPPGMSSDSVGDEQVLAPSRETESDLFRVKERIQSRPVAKLIRAVQPPKKPNLEKRESNRPISEGGQAAPGSGPGSGGGYGGGHGGGIGEGVGTGNGPGLPGEGPSRPAVLRAPRPPYPMLARSAGFEGKVLLEVLVRSDGQVGQVEVVQSSGRHDCDRAARETILESWLFAPAKLNGAPIDWREKVVVSYRLQ